jgi:hypothetical protein
MEKASSIFKEEAFSIITNKEYSLMKFEAKFMAQFISLGL